MPSLSPDPSAWFTSLSYTVPDKTNPDGPKLSLPLSSCLSVDDLWVKGKTVIMKLSGLKKLCDHADIVEKDFQMLITPTDNNKQQHGVNIWVGFKGDDNKDNWARGSGEASILNTGKLYTDKQGVQKYDEFGQIDSKYRLAMADKRAFARAVLNLVNLHGVYAEIESPDFMFSGASEQAPEKFNY